MNKRVGGVILSHGQLAIELLSAAEMVAGSVDNIKAVSIGWHDDVETAQNQLSQAIHQVQQGKGVLLLTDMFGGTTTNIAAMFLDIGNVEILTGVNLPMVIKLIQQDDSSTMSDVAKQLLAAGRDGIHQAGELLVPLKQK